MEWARIILVIKPRFQKIRSGLKCPSRVTLPHLQNMSWYMNSMFRSDQELRMKKYANFNLLLTANCSHTQASSNDGWDNHGDNWVSSSLIFVLLSIFDFNTVNKMRKSWDGFIQDFWFNASNNYWMLQFILQGKRLLSVPSFQVLMTSLGFGPAPFIPNKPASAVVFGDRPVNIVVRGQHCISDWALEIATCCVWFWRFSKLKWFHLYSQAWLLVVCCSMMFHDDSSNRICGDGCDSCINKLCTDLYTHRTFRWLVCTPKAVSLTSAYNCTEGKPQVQDSRSSLLLCNYCLHKAHHFPSKAWYIYSLCAHHLMACSIA